MSLLAAFQPLLVAITPTFNEAFVAYIAISVLVGIFIYSTYASNLLLKFIRGPDHKAGWSNEKKASYEKFKERAEFKRQFDREARNEIGREKRRWS